ncbi:DUF4837 family protein [uncultured Aquimarina sp.]|uniref:DUF4837 family protein n=1 Tax=uncultured Aquimarina sp. TaxID=575652 RepID=UPI00263560C0|nr:DUF4837 family protein [uncultured Aquimarina sp.]
MKKLALIIFSAVCLFGCKETKKDSSEEINGSLAQSIGKINELAVVVDNDVWTGSLGDSIRKYFGAEVPGLPQEEPLFSMKQIPSDAFTGLSRRYRLFLKVQQGDESKVYRANNKYATPQLGYVITGTSDEEIVKLIQERSADIIANYKEVETKEKQYRIKKSLEYIPQLKEKMGITLKMPSAYRIAKEEDKFFWLRKDVTNGDMNLMIYELPMGSIPKDSNTIAKIIKVRDSVGMLKIPTNSGKFITEKAYAPYLYETKLDDKFTFETKGTWEIKDRYMAGPFVNYVIDDNANSRQLVIEGFVLAPSVRKRDYMFELEAIIKSIKFE